MATPPSPWPHPRPFASLHTWPPPPPGAFSAELCTAMRIRRCEYADEGVNVTSNRVTGVDMQRL